jgi:diguanylate cyclase (GGDEF)-like protein
MLWRRSRRRALLEELARTRSGYDRALGDSGMVLFQQVELGVDPHHVSASAARLLGREPADFLVPGTLRSMVHPDDLSAFRAVVPVGPLPVPHTAPPAPLFSVEPAALPAQVGVEPVVRFRSADGSDRHVIVRRAAGRPDAPVAGVLVDVTVGASRRAEQRRFAELVELAPFAVTVLRFTDIGDPTSLVVVDANPRAQRMLRLTPTVLGAPTDTPIDGVFGPASAQLLRSALFDVAHTGESLSAKRLTFSELPGTYVDLRVDRLGDGTLGMILEDVTHEVTVEERLRHRASHDALTGLANRLLFDERVTAALASLAVADVTDLRDNAPAPVRGVLVIDVAGLHDVNAAHGHPVGDQLLVEVARRLSQTSMAEEIVARTGGDEFALLTRPAPHSGAVEARADAVRRILDEPVDVGGHLLEPRITVGTAVAPRDGCDTRSLLRTADAALHDSREPVAVMRVQELVPPDGVGLLTELRRGLANDELELRYQPVVELRSGRVTKVEASLRFQRTDGGTRLPVELLELAERSGLVQPLTRWVLGEAGRTAASLGGTTVAANLSLRNLGDTEFLSFLDLLARSGELQPSLVEVEIAETELMDDPVRGRDVVTRLAELGLAVIVDEFGSGYASVSSLAELGVRGIKVDRSFISTLPSVPADVNVVRSAVTAAHEHGLSVAAEGVTDGPTLTLLTELGCDLAQGVHLSEPVPVDDLARRVAELESALRGGWHPSQSLT